MRTWIFQANPKKYRILDAISELDKDSWFIRAHVRDVHIGDRVFIWKSGDNAGIYAAGNVLTEPRVMPCIQESAKFWQDENNAHSEMTRVMVSYEKKLLNHPLSRQALEDLGLRDLKVMRAFTGTNFDVSTEDASKINTLIQLLSSSDVPLIDAHYLANQDSYSNIPALHDANMEPPSRNTFIISRIIRDSGKIRAMKERYQHCCQVCGRQIQLGPAQKYSEGHHIRPLGGEHAGLDNEGNIIILCPNHHVLFDYGSLCLNPENLLLAHVNNSDPLHNQKLALLKHKFDMNSLRYAWLNLFQGNRQIP